MGGGKRRKQDKLSDKHGHEFGNNLGLNGPFYERTSKRSCLHLATIDSEPSQVSPLGEETRRRPVRKAAWRKISYITLNHRTKSDIECACP
jgi:hypothetical protein